MNKLSLHKYLVEFVGTLFLMFVILTTGNYLAIGAALGIAVLLGGAISGGAFNPAVTLALAFASKIQSKHILPYIAAQVLGAISAVLLLRL